MPLGRTPAPKPARRLRQGEARELPAMRGRQTDLPAAIGEKWPENTLEMDAVRDLHRLGALWSL